MKKKRTLIVLMTVMIIITISALSTICVYAANNDAVEEPAAAVEQTEADTEDKTISTKALAAAIVVSIVGTAGAIGMAFAICKSTEGMARQPEAAGKINSAMMLGLVFIETAIIYALIVAILIIFVL